MAEKFVSGGTWVTRDKPLLYYAVCPIPTNILHKKVVDFADINGAWKWEIFGHLLPDNIILIIASHQPPMDQRGEDQVYWAASKKGNFSTNSAYHAISAHNQGMVDQIWSLVWSWPGPQCIRIFIWLVLHDRLKTKVELVRRHISTGSHCDRCGDSLESTLYVLRDYMVAKRIWNRVIPEPFRQAFYSCNLKEWMNKILKNNWLFKEVHWRSFFGVAIWRLWFWRNQFLFNHNSLDSESMVNDIFMRAKEIQQINDSLLSLGVSKLERWIAWSPPTWPWCKLNTVGAAKRFGNSSAGGLATLVLVVLFVIAMGSRLLVLACISALVLLPWQNYGDYIKA